jgi:hypothetical protein
MQSFLFKKYICREESMIVVVSEVFWMKIKEIYHVKGGDILVLRVFSFKGHCLFQLYIDIDILIVHL